MRVDFYNWITAYNIREYRKKPGSLKLPGFFVISDGKGFSALPICRELGIDRVMVSCRDTNEGSRRTILANGGVYESTVHEPELQRDLERYWIHL